jgi:hypothetical protein
MERYLFLKIASDSWQVHSEAEDDDAHHQTGETTFEELVVE